MIISLCDHSCTALVPWLLNGHDCIAVDTKHKDSKFNNLTKVNIDVRDFKLPDCKIDFVYAWPPCTHLCASGARWWEGKGPEVLEEALEIVYACRKLCVESKARWLLENPVGRLATIWRPADYIFSPHEYGGYCYPPQDHYEKKTCLWTSSDFRMPESKPVPVKFVNKMRDLQPSPDRAETRSKTPLGFATAVYLANK